MSELFNISSRSRNVSFKIFDDGIDKRLDVSSLALKNHISSLIRIRRRNECGWLSKVITDICLRTENVHVGGYSRRIDLFVIKDRNGMKKLAKFRLDHPDIPAVKHTP